MKFIKSLILSTFILFSTACSAESFNIVYDNTTDIITVQTDNNSWSSHPINNIWRVLPIFTSPPGTLAPSKKNTQVVEFEFMSPNYFDPNKSQHFGIFLRGDLHTNTGDSTYPYRGHGVIFGSANVEKDHSNGYHCGRIPESPKHNTAIEVAGYIPNTGEMNCLFGGSTSGKGLSNNVEYKIVIRSSYNEVTQEFVTSYVLSEWDSSKHRYEQKSSASAAYSYPNLPKNLGGVYMNEFSDQIFYPYRTSSWNIEIWSYREYWTN